MSKTIQKLNKLKNPESFIQINTIRGFKYVDRAGEIVNAYHKKNSAPQFQMGLSGLVIEQPKDKIDELKVTAQVIWAKFSEIDSLDSISNLFAKESENILHHSPARFSYNATAVISLIKSFHWPFFHPQSIKSGIIN